jgi:predicted nucleic acid-binding protein
VDCDEAIAALALCYEGAIITCDRHVEMIPELKVIGY